MPILYKYMKLKMQKKYHGTSLPQYAHPGEDAGLDLIAYSTTPHGNRDEYGLVINTHKVEVNFGIAVEIPPGYVGKLHARSSIHKTCCRLSNGVGVIDSGYRGELKAVFDVLPHLSYLPMPDWSKPCAQLIIEPYIGCEVEEVDTLSPSARGEGGYGSTDRKTNNNE